VKLGHTEILVTDPQAAKRFYVDVLGFELEADQGGQFFWVSMGDALFLLRPGRTAPPAADYGSAASALVLYTDDLDGEIERLEARGLEFAGTDGSDRCPTFRDPDGNWFQLVNPADH
jgi:catechol 2,3-dioxygenase-like lactoylglutathione lyase family enzyme